MSDLSESESDNTAKTGSANSGSVYQDGDEDSSLDQSNETNSFISQNSCESNSLSTFQPSMEEDLYIAQDMVQTRSMKIQSSAKRVGVGNPAFRPQCGVYFSTGTLRGSLRCTEPGNCTAKTAQATTFGLNARDWRCHPLTSVDSLTSRELPIITKNLVSGLVYP